MDKAQGQTSVDAAPVPEASTSLDTLVRGHGMEDAYQDYVRQRFDSLWNCCSSWRTAMERFQRVSDENLQDRVGLGEKYPGQDWLRIFEHCNATLGLAAGFADFMLAQISNDIFGAKPWLTIKPVGVLDVELARQIERHAHWKFSSSNIKTAYRAALRRCISLGTSFPKWLWRIEDETWERTSNVLHANGVPVVVGGRYVDEQMFSQFAPDDPELPPGDEWKPLDIEERETIFANCVVHDVSFRDICWDITAPEFDLVDTDVFTRVRLRAMDAVRIYGLKESTVRLLLDAGHGLDTQSGHDPEQHRSESAPELVDSSALDLNHYIELWEGYMRFDPVGDGKYRRQFVLYSSQLNRVLLKDYLANRTPAAMLPVRPIRIYRVPGRAYGIGIFERFENGDTLVDALFSGMVHRNRFSANPITGVDESKINNFPEDRRLNLADPLDLKPDAKVTDAIQFAKFPDLDGKTQNLIEMRVQAEQMRSGISAASQGELSTMPDTNTATGINALMSRAAKLIKLPADDIKDDVERGFTYGVTLLYANHNVVETFVWGEGRSAQLIELDPASVRNLRMDVTVNISQAQNVERLESSNAAVQDVMAYMKVPDPFKPMVRDLFVQIIQSRGFDNADTMLPEIAAPVPVPAAGPEQTQAEQPQPEQTQPQPAQ